MKKNVLMAIMMAVAMLMIGCGNDTTPASDNDPIIDNDPVADQDKAQPDPDVVSDPDVITPDEDTEESDEDTGPLCEPGDYPNTCGTWAMKTIFSAIAKILSIDAAKAEVVTYYLVKQGQNGANIDATSTICYTNITNNTMGMIDIVFPPTFVEALAERPLPKKAVLAEEDGKYTYYQPPFWEIRSVDPACVTGDPKDYVLPKNADDPCAQDWDNDGIKGLKVLAKGTLASGATEIVEKSSTELWGQVVGEGQTMVLDGGYADSTTGHLIFSDEQAIMWYDNPALAAGAQNKYDKDRENSWIQVRVPDTADCEYVVNNAATLFQR